MIIPITDDIVFDTEKSFDEQECNCQQYFYDIMNNETPKTTYDDFERPVTEIWLVEKINWLIIRESVYKKQEPDWHLLSQTIKLKENE